MLQHLLITAQAAGDLPYLARLFTTIKGINGTLDGAVKMIDTGGAWSADSWLCQATENRAPYVVLDAMAYYLMFVDGLDDPALDRIAGHVMAQLATPRAFVPLELDGGLLWLKRDESLREARRETDELHLPVPPKGEIYRITLDPLMLLLLETQRYLVPDDALPDATIVGTIEFVENEARYYQKRRRRSPDDE
ncbi:MAG: hypothetical protein ACLFTK_05090 [Anaerolineales bacterium]